MAQDELLAHIQKLLEANNGVIRQEIQAQGQTVRKDLRQEIQSAKTEVINAVRKAEDEVIETLRDTTGVVATKQNELENRLNDIVGVSHSQ